MKPEDKDRKKAWVMEQKARARADFPLSDADLLALFEYIESEIGRCGCADDRRLTRAWLEDRHLDVVLVLAWLDTAGGFCDCEVASNARDHWETNRR